MGVSILTTFQQNNEPTFLSVRCEKTSSLIISNFSFSQGQMEKILSVSIYMVMKLRQKFCNKHLTLLKRRIIHILYGPEIYYSQSRFKEKKTNRIKCDKKLYFSFICVVVVVATTHTQTQKRENLFPLWWFIGGKRI